MKSNRNISYFLNNLSVKHRLSFRDEHNDKEVWYMHIRPIALAASFLALVLVIFIIVISIAAFTPVLDMVPGHPGNRSREALIENIIRIDSLEQRMVEIKTYTDNIGLIMSGKVPVTHFSRKHQDSLKSSESGEVARNAADSLIRAQLEGTGSYALPDPSSAQKARLAGLQLTTPVKGVKMLSFSPMENRFGTSIATTANQEILAIADGTVIMATWSPADNYMIQIQHADNMISVYKHCGQLLKTTGTRVMAGEVIGYTMDNLPTEDGGKYFYLELWYGGAPVDSENYITF